MSGIKIPGVVFTLGITIAVALIHENLTGQYALYGDILVAALLAVGKVLEVNSKPAAAPPGAMGAPMYEQQPSKTARVLMGG